MGNGCTSAPSGYRPSAETALDAPARAALRPGHQDRAAPAVGRREAPRGVRHLVAVEQVLAPLGWHINTAFVERVNLTIRQHVAAVGRRVSTLCKGEEGLRQQLALHHVYYNFCLPHASLRQPLSQPEPTKASARPRRAALDASDGRWPDGSRLDAARGVALSRAAVATTSVGVRKRAQGGNDGWP